MASDDPIEGLKAKVHRNERSGTVQRIYSITERIVGKVPRTLAQNFLKHHAGELGLHPALEDLKFDIVRKSIFGTHVLFQQYRAGKPISGAWIRVDLSKQGRLLAVQNDTVPQAIDVRRAARIRAISRPQALRSARAAVKAEEKHVRSAEQVWWPVNGVPVEAWKVMMRTRGKEGLWRIYVDAYTAKVIEKKDTILKARGRIFDPSPPTALDDPRIDPAIKELPERSYRIVKLQGLDGSGYLEGANAVVRTLGRRVKRTDGEFIFDRNDARFREVMAYHHIDQAARHVQRLGFKDLFPKPIRAYVDGTDEDNSWYDPGKRRRWLVFGTGGSIPDAEDAEVIVHEYGHAVQDAQVPGWGDSKQSKAMGEGFSDFLAASHFFARKPKRFRDRVFVWDSMGESSGRSLVERVSYPDDFVNRVDNEHSNGQIWSACLWKLRTMLGPRRAERVVIASHYLCTRSASFRDAAHRILEANERLYKDRDRKAIRALFEKRGILEPK